MHERSVLLVEDNRLLRWWMTMSLQREGFRVVAPETVDEAISIASVTTFDTLITDWRLAQGRDGLEILNRVRERFPGTLAILISAEADAELSARAQAGGFHRVIKKPFSAAEIVGAVKRLSESVHSEVGS